MKMTITSTDKIVELSGPNGDMPARVWEGTSEGGTPVIVFVTRIAVSKYLEPGSYTEFERELEEHTPPTAEVRSWPARMVLD